MNTDRRGSKCGQVGVTVKRLSLSRRRSLLHLEDSGQDASQGSLGPGHGRFLFGEAAGLLQRPSSEERDTGKHAGGGGLEERRGTESTVGRAITIHQRLGTFAEVYWKFSPLSCSIKRKKEEKTTCCNFLCHRTCSGKNRPDPLLHFPICTNGQSPHPEPPLLLAQLLRDRSQEPSGTCLPPVTPPPWR